jgi:hypothetical protein
VYLGMSSGVPMRRVGAFLEQYCQVSMAIKTQILHYRSGVVRHRTYTGTLAGSNHGTDKFRAKLDGAIAQVVQS